MSREDMVSFRMTRGDTFSRGLRITRGGVPLLLGEGDVGRLRVFGDDGAVVAKTLTSEAQDAQTGVLSLALEPSDTEGLEAGDYRVELELSLADGTVITPLRGLLRIVADLITPENRNGGAQA